MYTPTQWTPRLGTDLDRFEKIGETTQFVRLVNTPTAVTQAGTYFSTDRMNNIESGIVDNDARIEDIEDIYKPVSFNGAFAGLSQTARNWYGMTTLGNDVYCADNGGDIYKQTNGTGNFIALGQTSRNWGSMASDGVNVYASDQTTIYKQTNGEGDFVAMPYSFTGIYGIDTDGIDFYVSTGGSGKIYKQVNMTGDFVDQQQTVRNYGGIKIYKNNVYAGVLSGDIYKQTGKTGDFIALNQTSGSWKQFDVLDNDIYVVNSVAAGGDVYKQTNGDGDFEALNLDYIRYDGIAITNNKIYVSSIGDDIYTAPVYPDNTIKIASSFTLPEHSVGNRRRILNTHTSAITLTMPSGETLDGAGTYSLAADAMIEIEKTSDTTWTAICENGEAMQTIDHTNRTLDINGDNLVASPVSGSLLLDRSGTNNLTNYGVTPVDTPRGKGLYFNGSAYLVADNPVLGASGTLAIDFTTGADVTTTQIVLTNANTSSRKGYICVVENGKIKLSVCSDTAEESIEIYTGLLAETYYSLSISINGSSITGRINGDSFTKTKTLTPTFEDNLFVGVYGNGSSLPYTGTISRLYYTTDIWSDAEHRAWYLGAETPDCVQYSATPDEGKVMVWGESGFVGFDTPTGSSTGKQGQIKADASYIYICTATDTWKRTALSTF